MFLEKMFRMFQKAEQNHLGVCGGLRGVLGEFVVVWRCFGGVCGVLGEFVVVWGCFGGVHGGLGGVLR